eukprot:14771795-Heterocapsa_arctica.AAC.1
MPCRPFLLWLAIAAVASALLMKEAVLMSTNSEEAGSPQDPGHSHDEERDDNLIAKFYDDMVSEKFTKNEMNNSSGTIASRPTASTCTGPKRKENPGRTKNDQQPGHHREVGELRKEYRPQEAN